jgi:5-formyltetrahydrofolate cyclo-ligase
VRVLRASCDPALGGALAAGLLAAAPPPPGAVIGGFWPLAGEIDPRPLLVALHARGHRIGLPQTPPPGEALRFRRWQPGAPLIRGRFGTLYPEGEEVVPQWLAVPLLAFDRAGRRLGYGGGYYDRTLARLRGAVAVGCAFACQQVDFVPAGEYDVRLFAVATERGVVFCSGE